MQAQGGNIESTYQKGYRIVSKRILRIWRETRLGSCGTALDHQHSTPQRICRREISAAPAGDETPYFCGLASSHKRNRNGLICCRCPIIPRRRLGVEPKAR